SIAAGAPVFDIVRLLGTLVVDPASPLWWPIGVAMHAAIGAVWAIFYAHVFWAAFDWKPVLQGLAFSAVPALASGLVMVQRIAEMHPLVLSGQLPEPGLFAWRLGW